MQLSIIVAVARNGVIGNEGCLPWRLSSDLRRFKQVTMGHSLVMGRRTFESIGRPLPGRRSIVVTSSAIHQEGVQTAASLSDALHQSADAEHVFAVGGAGVYREALPLACRVYLTRVEAIVQGDTYFPLDEMEGRAWELVTDEPHAAGPRDAFPFRWQIYHRRH